ncbi:hypothetical protein [Winogradskyella flava]|uniref:Uncharacterized protein n=1 Tax=Winogradskyella flava TaxID=1884876 RepID=A0A842IYL2_9FLAO|nr:hypothetical protein [Winogradskyella flava]MBC2845858.1 hypothetical protein [Winogradskyella flava]
MKKDKLHNIKSTGYKTPDNYFEVVEDKIFTRLSEKESVGGIQDEGFRVPDDYFDTIEDKVFSKLNDKYTPVVQLRSRKTLYYIAGLAASIMLLLAIFINKNTSEDISVEMVETYLENRNLDSYELAELLSDANLLEEDFTIITTPYEEENLEDYLLDNADIETYLE